MNQKFKKICTSNFWKNVLKTENNELTSIELLDEELEYYRIHMIYYIKTIFNHRRIQMK